MKKALLFTFLLLASIVSQAQQEYAVTTFAGGFYQDGPASTARFPSPTGTCLDANGNVYVADENRIRKISPNGIVSTLAGSGNSAHADGIGTAASFNNPKGLAVDASGNVYVADGGNNRIRKITATGVVTTFAGSGTAAYADGTGTSASFNSPEGVSLDASGNVYVADGGNNRIRKITTAGVVITFAGSGNNAYVDGIGPVASFFYPRGVAVDASGNVYVADAGNNRIRKITAVGVVTTLAGSGNIGIGVVDGIGTAAAFSNPSGVAIDAFGNVYVADAGSSRIRKITSLGVVTTIAGSVNPGYSDGTGTTASFNNPRGVAVDASGNVYVADRKNNRIRKITAAGEVTTLAGLGSDAYLDGTGAAASFYSPTGVTVDAIGNVYVADQENNRIRKITATGIATTFAGSGRAAYADGTGRAASFNNPKAVAIDASGNVYVADYGNNRIRKITSDGVVTTFAGSGDGAYIDGAGTAASFGSPSGVALDAFGNVFVADAGNNRIRKITTDGVVTSLAGSGSPAYADGTGTAASFDSPQGVAVDASGNVYVADAYNHLIRKITAAGVVTTLAGSGSPAYVNGAGTAASFYFPNGVSVDASGNVYVADRSNHRIRKITATGEVTNLAGSGISVGLFSGVYADGTGNAASFAFPTGVAVDASGNVYVADQFNNRIRKILINPTSVNSKFETSLSIYPNPAASHFTMEVTNLTNVLVLNSLGQVVITQKVSGTSEISTAQLASGMHTVLAEGYKATSLVVSK